MKSINRFVRDESGVSAIEYGLIAALVAVAMIAGLRELGTWLGDTFDEITNSL